MSPTWSGAIFCRRWCALLFVSLAALSAFAAPPTHFYFVQITDTHWGARDGAALTRRAVEAINQLPFKIEFVVHTGDMLADSIGTETVVQDGQDAMKALTVPVYYVPGNHDILESDLPATVALYRKYFGPLSRQVEVQGVACLFFYSEPLAGGFRVRGYDPLAWLEDNLKQAGDKPVLLFQHSPSVGNLFDKRDASGWEAATRKAGMTRAQVRDLLGTPMVADAFHGDRWDYAFSLRRKGVLTQSRRLTVFFKADVMDRFESDPMPTEAEFVASLDTVRRDLVVPLLEAAPESLKGFADPVEVKPATPELPPLPVSYPPLEGPAR